MLIVIFKALAKYSTEANGSHTYKHYPYIENMNPSNAIKAQPECEDIRGTEGQSSSFLSHYYLSFLI